MISELGLRPLYAARLGQQDENDADVKTFMNKQKIEGRPPWGGEKMRKIFKHRSLLFSSLIFIYRNPVRSEKWTRVYIAAPPEPTLMNGIPCKSITNLSFTGNYGCITMPNNEFASGFTHAGVSVAKTIPKSSSFRILLESPAHAASFTHSLTHSLFLKIPPGTI